MRCVASGGFGLLFLVASVGCVDSSVVPTVDSGSLDGGVAQEFVLQPAGGEASLGAVRLTVPPGAVRAATTIRVRTHSAGPAGFEPRSPVFEFEPAGLTFDPPLTVSLELSVGTERLGWVWSRLDGSGYDVLEGTAEGGRITGRVRHFSRGAVVSLPDQFDMCEGECPDGFAWSGTFGRCEAGGHAPAWRQSCTRIAGRSYPSCEDCAEGYHLAATELSQRCGTAFNLIGTCERIGDSRTLVSCERTCPLGFRGEPPPAGVVPRGCGVLPALWDHRYCVRNEQCLPSNCPGCCVDDQVCATGNLATRCGAGGAACRACPAGQICGDGRCVDPCGPANCTGCCSAGGQCVGGASDTLCGQGGGLCATCSGDQQCAGGRCVPRCGPGNCTGCCAANGVCVTATSNESCGRSGQRCVACGGAQRCDAGACVAACPDVAGTYVGTFTGPQGTSDTSVDVYVDSQCVVSVGSGIAGMGRIENGQLRQVGDCNLEVVSDFSCCDWTFSGSALTGTCIAHPSAICGIPGRCTGVCHGSVCAYTYSYRLTRLARCTSNGDCAALQVCTLGQCRPCTRPCQIGAACGDRGVCGPWGNGCSTCSGTGMM